MKEVFIIYLRTLRLKKKDYEKMELEFNLNLSTS